MKLYTGVIDCSRDSPIHVWSRTNTVYTSAVSLVGCSFS